MPTVAKKAPRTKRSRSPLHVQPSTASAKVVLKRPHRVVSVRPAPPKRAPQPVAPPAPPPVRLRPNQADLTPKKWSDLITAFFQLRQLGIVPPGHLEFASAYRHEFHQHQAHGLPYFLPWQREHLLQFENRLLRLNPKLVLPYWNWLTQPRIPNRLATGGEWGVVRHPKVVVGPELKIAVENAMQKTSYNDFSCAIEEVQRAVHALIGGQMAQIENSPHDVLFWLHHAFIDKLWAEWQAAHPKADPTSAAYDIWLKPQTMAGRPFFVHKAREMWKIDAHHYRYV